MMEDSMLHVSHCSDCEEVLEENETYTCVTCGKILCNSCIINEQCKECTGIEDDDPYYDSTNGISDIDQI